MNTVHRFQHLQKWKGSSIEQKWSKHASLAATVQVMLPELILQEYLIYVTKKAPNQKWLTLGTNTWPKKILKMRYFN